MTTYLWVCLGAAVGAPVRYLVDVAVRARTSSAMPWGTLLVNVVGSLVLGLLTGLTTGHEVPEAVRLALGTGLCGALTTWSTLGHDTWRLAEEGLRRTAVVNLALSLLLGLAAALAGYAAGATI